MEIGHLDVCLTVKDVNATFEFYSKLGFEKDEGNLSEGWVVMKKPGARLAFFEPRAGGGDCTTITLNFRGGNIKSVTEELSNRGINFEGEVVAKDDGSGSANIKDPDGYHVFLDTEPGEKPKL